MCHAGHCIHGAPVVICVCLQITLPADQAMSRFLSLSRAWMSGLVSSKRSHRSHYLRFSPSPLPSQPHYGPRH